MCTEHLGSSADFYNYLLDTDLQQQANLISIDHLGYGYSNFGKAETSLKKQADFVNYVTAKYKDNAVILVGWSFGGPIICKAAIVTLVLNMLF